MVVAAIWFGFRRGPGSRLATGLLVALTVDAFVLAGWFGHGMNSLFPPVAMAAAIGKTAARNRIEAVQAARRNGWV